MANPPPKNAQAPLPLTPENLLNAFNRLIHPHPTALESQFRRIGIFIAGALLLGLIFLSSPFAPDPLTCEVSTWLLRVIGTKEAIKHVCDWLTIVSQIAIVLFIGGIAFTESFAHKVSGFATRLQQATIEIQEEQSKQQREALQRALDRLVAIGGAKDSYGRKVRDALAACYTIYNDAAHLSDRYIWFGTRGLAFNFPGGLYGVLGFVFLLIQVLAVSTKILFDYLPAACLPSVT